MSYLIYGIGFFVCTLILQYMLFKAGHYTKSGPYIWTGTAIVFIFCFTGIFIESTASYSSIIGFLLADDIGKALGWHK